MEVYCIVMGTENDPSYGYDVNAMQLRDLMDHRGQEGILKIQQQFGNVQGLCNALHTSTNEGMSINSSLNFINLIKFFI